MVTAENSAGERIAELTAQVEALEVALRQRSRELRLLQARLGARDLVSLSLLGTRGAYHPDLWLETAIFTPAEVDETLKDLWDWLASQREPTDYVTDTDTDASRTTARTDTAR